MKTNFEKYSAAIAITALSIVGAKADLWDAAYNGNGTMTGQAVLGTSGDTWNNPNAFGTTFNLNDVSGISPITMLLTGTGALNIAYNYASYGMATDPAPIAALMQNVLVTVGGTAQLTIGGLSSYIGDTFTLVLLSGEPFTTTTTYSIASGATGGNTGSPVTTANTDIKLSGGIGDAYNEFTGGTITSSSMVINESGFGAMSGFQLQITPAPEPTTLALAAMGGFGMLAMFRRRQA